MGGNIHLKKVRLGVCLRCLFLVCLTGCGKPVESYYPAIERGELHVGLWNGETIQVKDYHVETDRVWFLFIDDVVSWAPVEQVVLESSADSINTGFHTEYLNQPKRCAKADWLSYESWELVEALQGEEVETTIGNYEIREKAHHRGDTKVDIEKLTFNDLKYYPQKRSVDALFHVLERDVAYVLSKGEAQINLSKYIPIAADLDILIAVELAEADLRQATYKNRRKKIERCLELYLLAGQDDKLAEFFENPYHWIPVTKSSILKPLLRGLEEKVQDPVEYELYSELLEGNLKDFMKKYVPYKEANNPLKSKSKLKNLAVGTSYEAGSLDDLVERVKRIAAVRGYPFLERMAKFSEEDVISRLSVQEHLYGAMSQEVANTILYLIEQRQYCGTDIPVGMLLWAGIYTFGKDHLRAAPIFHLTQKTAGVNFNGQYWGKGALRAQFGVEASGYFIECFDANRGLRQKEPFNQTANEMSDFAFNLGVMSPENSKANQYASMALNYRIKILKDPENPEMALSFLQESLDSGKLTDGDIMRAISYIARIQAYRQRNPDQAWETYEELITGKYQGVKRVMYALTEYCRIARKYPEQIPNIQRNVQFYRDAKEITEEEYQRLVTEHPTVFQNDEKNTL